MARPVVGFHGYLDALENVFSKTVVGQMAGRPMLMMPFDLKFW